MKQTQKGAGHLKIVFAQPPGDETLKLSKIKNHLYWVMYLGTNVDHVSYSYLVY